MWDLETEQKVTIPRRILSQATADGNVWFAAKCRWLPKMPLPSLHKFVQGFFQRMNEGPVGFPHTQADAHPVGHAVAGLRT